MSQICINDLYTYTSYNEYKCHHDKHTNTIDSTDKEN